MGMKPLVQAVTVNPQYSSLPAADKCFPSYPLQAQKFCDSRGNTAIVKLLPTIMLS